MMSHSLRSPLARQAFVIVAAAAFAGGFVAGRVSRSPGSASGAAGAELAGGGGGLRMTLAEVRESWAAAVQAAKPDGVKLSADALAPVDSYFRDRALPNVEPFVKDMAGFFTSINLTWLKVRDWWSKPQNGERGRVEAKVAEALERRMGMPSELEAAVAAAVQRFEALQNQADARFRNEAYSVLRGAGVRVDAARLDEVRVRANHAALVEALHGIGAKEAEQLAAGSIGGLVSSVVVDAVVTSAVASAVASGVGAAGGAGGAAAGGAAAGGAVGSGVPVAGTVAGVIVGGVAGTLVYLAADSYFETKAKARLTDAVKSMHAETRGTLDELFRAYGEELDKQRMGLLDRLLVEGMAK
jgi:hypothetical protein